MATASGSGSAFGETAQEAAVTEKPRAAILKPEELSPELRALERRRRYLDDRGSKRNVSTMPMSLRGLSDKLSDRRFSRCGFASVLTRFRRV